MCLGGCGMPALPTQEESFIVSAAEHSQNSGIDGIRQQPADLRRGMTHLVHTAPGRGIELTLPDAVLTIKIDAEHTDGQYEVFEVDAPRGPTTATPDWLGQGLLRP